MISNHNYNIFRWSELNWLTDLLGSQSEFLTSVLLYSNGHEKLHLEETPVLHVQVGQSQENPEIIHEKHMDSSSYAPRVQPLGISRAQKEIQPHDREQEMQQGLRNIAAWLR